MANCEPYSDRLLDFVYGLLDEADAQALRTHLETCPRCQQSLRGAHGQQTLFARAALPIGPDAVATFSPPAEEPLVGDTTARDGSPVAQAPATLAFAVPAAAVAPRRARRRYWLAGAAAAVLLLVGALTYAYQDGLAARERAVVQHKEIVREIDRQLIALEPAFHQQAQELEQKLRAEAPPHLYALAPAQIPMEGAAAVQVAVNGPHGKPAEAKVAVTLTDAEGKKVLERREVLAQRGTANVVFGEELSDALHGHKLVRLVAEAEVGQARAHLDESLKVAAPVYVAHLMTNQSVYRPRELLLFRALVLDRASLTPPAQPIALRFSLVDAAGKMIAATSAITSAGGIASKEMAVAETWPDGEYELRVASLNPEAADVRPHARKLHLVRDAARIAQADRSLYRAGDIVNFSLQRPPMQNNPPEAQRNATNTASPSWELYLNDRRMPLSSSAMGGFGGGAPGGYGGMSRGGGYAVPPPAAQSAPSLGGGQMPPAPVPAPGGRAAGPAMPSYGTNAPDWFAADKANQMYFQFALPKDLDTSRVRVRLVLTEGTVRETFEQELAVVPSRLSVDLFPEGGDLIAGVPNRVYYRVRTPRGEAVNPEGRVIVLSRSDVLLDSAPGAGSGSFTFTPQAGDTYSVRITNPGSDPIELPDPFARIGGAHQDGLVLHAPRPVAAEGEPVDVVLRNPGAARRVLLVAQCRGRFVGQQWVETAGAETRVAMGTLPAARGLVRLTAYDAGAGTLTPLAERLIYRTPARWLDLAVLHLGGVIAAKQGQKNVQLDVRCRDESGAPHDAWLGVSIAADDSLDGRQPNPLGHFFIAGDVQDGDDLDNAALLAADNPAAQQALDLFLGTVGWRRFQPARGDANAVGAPVDAAFVGRENASPRDLQAQLAAKLDEALTPLRLAMQRKHAEQTADQQAAQTMLAVAEADLREFEARPKEYFRLGLLVAIMSLLAVACVTLAVGAWRLLRRHTATPLFAGSFACLSVCLLAMLLLGSLAPPTDPGAPAFVANRERLPDRPNVGRVLDVPAGLPTGPFAFAHSPARRALDAPLVVADAAKAEERKQSHVDRLAALQLQHGIVARQLRSKVAATKQEKDSLLQLQQRYSAALQEQSAAVAKAHTEFLPRPATAMAPKAPGAFGKGGKAGGDEKSKIIAKHADEMKADRDGAHREFIPDLVAGVEFDTLLWHPSLHAGGGAAQIAFDIPVTPGSYRVQVLGNSADGRLGFYEGRLEIQPDVGR